MSPSTGACFRKANPSFRQTFWEEWLAGSMIASSSPENDSTGAGQQSLARLGRVPKSSRLRHQPVPPFQTFLAFESEVIDAGIADDHA